MREGGREGGGRQFEKESGEDGERERSRKNERDRKRAEGWKEDNGYHCVCLHALLLVSQTRSDRQGLPSSSVQVQTT